MRYGLRVVSYKLINRELYPHHTLVTRNSWLVARHSQLSYILFNQADQFVALYHSGLSPDLLSVLEEHQGGYGLYAVLHGQCLLFVYIYFNDACLVAHTAFYVFQYGVHHLTGTAPGCVEVYKYGHCCAVDQVFKFFHNCSE